MERLNEIMARTAQQPQRRHRTTEQRSPQDATTAGQRPLQQPQGETPPPRLRRPLPEQTARLERPTLPVSRPYNQQNQYTRPPRTHGARGRPSGPQGALQRPVLPAEADAQASYQQRFHAPQELQYSPASDYYEDDDHRAVAKSLLGAFDGASHTVSQMASPTQDRHQAPSAPPIHSLSLQHSQAGQAPGPIRPTYPLPVPTAGRSGNSPDDDHASMVQADVAEEWEDDTAGMLYGDWENDEQEAQAYARPRAEQASRVNRPLTPQELPPAASSRPYVAHAPREVLMPPSPPPLPTQEMRHYQRTTQPLNPHATLRMSQDMPQEAPPLHTARPTRQLVGHEQEAQSIPAPYTPPTKVCPICKGAGYLRADVPFGHPNFGKPIPCECKEAERAAKRRLQLEALSNLGDVRDKNFKNFHANVSRAVHMAYQVALEYAQDPQGWLVLIGRTGCGKTHLAAAIANRCLARGSLVLFSPVIELLDHLRATFVPTSTEVYDQLFAKMREAELLVLDDLGAQQSSPWANEKLFQLLNYRYNSRFPTVITTNNIGLQGIEERIRSRMTDASLAITVTFDGAQDYRPRNPRRE